ncbi:MAG: hypothetical protein HYR80_01670 [Nitrospirae bacterium]|nr:hypothetical protein [Nitrospirota bacterium]
MPSGESVICFESDPALFANPDFARPKTLLKFFHPIYRKPSLLSAALITDDPHPEVAAAGHDRTPIPLKRSAAEAWLHAASIDEALAIIKEERERPYFSHRVLGAA